MHLSDCSALGGMTALELSEKCEVEEEVVLEEIITIEGEVEDIFPIPLEDEEDEVIHK